MSDTNSGAQRLAGRAVLCLGVGFLLASVWVPVGMSLRDANDSLRKVRHRVIRAKALLVREPLMRRDLARLERELPGLRARAEAGEVAEAERDLSRLKREIESEIPLVRKAIAREQEHLRRREPVVRRWELLVGVLSGLTLLLVAAALVLLVLAWRRRGTGSFRGRFSGLLWAVYPSLTAALMPLFLLSDLPDPVGLRKHDGFATLLGCGVALLFFGTRLPRRWSAVRDNPDWSLRGTREAQVLTLAPTFFVNVGLSFIIALSLGGLLIPHLSFLPGMWSVAAVLAAAGTMTALSYKAAGWPGKPPYDRGRWRRMLAQCGMLGVLAASSVGIAHVVWSGRLDALKQDLRSRGAPISLAEFHREIPPEENAFPMLMKVLEGFDHGINKRTHPGLKLGRWSAAVFEVESPLVKRNEAYIAGKIAPLVRRFRHYSCCDYRLAAQNPFKISLPPSPDFVAAFRALALSAGAKSYRGNRDEAWERIRTGLELMELQGQEPQMIAQRVNMAGFRIMAVASANILLQHPRKSMPNDIAARLKKALAEEPIRRGFEYKAAYLLDARNAAGRLEEPFAHGCLDDCGADAAIFLMNFSWKMSPSLGAMDAYTIVAAEHYSRLAAARNPSEFRRRVEEMTRRLESLPVWPHLFTRWGVLKLSGLKTREWEVKSYVRLGLVCSALAEFRRQNGRYPKGLRELAPRYLAAGTLRDLFGEGDLGYALDPEGSGFELFSVGPAGDRKDTRQDTLALRQRW